MARGGRDEYWVNSERGEVQPSPRGRRGANPLIGMVQCGLCRDHAADARFRHVCGPRRMRGKPVRELTFRDIVSGDVDPPADGSLRVAAGVAGADYGSSMRQP